MRAAQSFHDFPFRPDAGKYTSCPDDRRYSYENFLHSILAVRHMMPQKTLFYENAFRKPKSLPGRCQAFPSVVFHPWCCLYISFMVLIESDFQEVAMDWKIVGSRIADDEKPRAMPGGFR
jgi:hypothetical protein